VSEPHDAPNVLVRDSSEKAVGETALTPDRREGSIRRFARRCDRNPGRNFASPGRLRASAIEDSRAHPGAVAKPDAIATGAPGAKSRRRV
jgi:hypothetical protein